MKTCKKRKEAITEQDLWVDGEFLSEADMKENGFKEPLICKYVSQNGKEHHGGLWFLIAVPHTGSWSGCLWHCKVSHQSHPGGVFEEQGMGQDWYAFAFSVTILPSICYLMPLIPFDSILYLVD